MGRAIVRDPQVFLMDEPLSNLDAKLRVQTRTEIARLQSDARRDHGLRHPRPGRGDDDGRPHRRASNAGVLQQVGTPLELYDRPANLFVAGFIGSPQMNLLKARADESGQARIGNYLVPVDDDRLAKRMSGDITVGVRPEAWRIVGPDDGGLPVTVTVVEELGADAFIYGTCDVEGTPGSVIVRLAQRGTVARGDVVHVTTDPRHVHVFDTATGARLSE